MRGFFGVLCLIDVVTSSCLSQSQIIMWDVQKKEIKGFLRGHTDIVLDLLPLPRNCGGSAGFAMGIPALLLVSCSMVWSSGHFMVLL